MTATIGLLVFLGKGFGIWNPETPQEFLLVIVVFLGITFAGGRVGTLVSRRFATRLVK